MMTAIDAQLKLERLQSLADQSSLSAVREIGDWAIWADEALRRGDIDSATWFLAVIKQMCEVK